MFPVVPGWFVQLDTRRNDDAHSSTTTDERRPTPPCRCRRADTTMLIPPCRYRRADAVAQPHCLPAVPPPCRRRRATSLSCRRAAAAIAVQPLQLPLPLSYRRHASVHSDSRVADSPSRLAAVPLSPCPHAAVPLPPCPHAANTQIATPNIPVCHNASTYTWSMLGKPRDTVAWRLTETNCHDRLNFVQQQFARFSSV